MEMYRKQSKANQEKHDRMLNELFKLLGNNQCADCGSKNPRWASYSLGVFLCIRCASLHRKMGTHVSKVKSCSMDFWTLSEIQNMKNLGGNTLINNQMNPKASSNLPMAALDDDHVMEKFIRDKWEKKSFVSRTSPTIMPSPSSTNSSLISSPPMPQQQHLVKPSRNPFLVDPFLVNPFAAHFEAQHVAGTTPTFPTTPLTTNPFLKKH